MDTLFWFVVLFFFLPTVVKFVQKFFMGNTARVITPYKNPFAKLFQHTMGTQQNTTTTNTMPYKNFYTRRTLWMIALVIALVVFLFNAVVIVPAGHTGVRILFGNVKADELSAGVHIINPLESVKNISIRTQSYTMSSVHGEGQVKGADQIEALTNEGLSIDLDITVQYRVIEKDASEIYKTIGGSLGVVEGKIIRPEIRSGIREIIARYDAKAVYSDKRTEVTDNIKDVLAQSLAERGIFIENVLLRNVVLPTGLAGSIQQKLQAEQDAQRLDFILEKEKKEAERKRIEASGQSDAQNILNATLTPRYLQYLYISELKDREGTIYVPTGNDGLPIFKGI